MKKWLQSLRIQLILTCSLITAGILFMVILACLLAFRSSMIQNSIQTSDYNIKNVMSTIDNRIKRISNFSNWCTASNQVTTFVWDSSKYRNEAVRKKLKAHDTVTTQLQGSGLGDYVNKVIITAENGSYIQAGGHTGNPTDAQVCSSLPWFEEVMKPYAPTKLFLADEPFQHKSFGLGIPFGQTIPPSAADKMPGWIYISLNPYIITQSLEQYASVNGQKQYLLMDDMLYDISDKTIGTGIPRTELPISEIEYKHFQDSDYLTFINARGKKETAVYCSSEYYGMILVETLNTGYLMPGNQTFREVIIFLSAGILLLNILIIIFINRTFNKPLENLLNRINRISCGDFSVVPESESSNEIGRIGHGINEMAESINTFMTRQLEHEKKQKDLELKMLQNQINPHFLYNTLNSIKMMAVIQKNPGIVTVVTSLAVLLKNIAKGTDEIIPLKQELSLLQEYINIQRYRSGGLFEIEYEFQSDELKECAIIKFTLQPIVENAIFHGLENKTTAGRILISVSQPETGILQIKIADNGVGMSPEQIVALMNGTSDNSRKFNNIGFKNVDERIKLTFGNDYGLSVDSRKGVYTRVTVTLPYQFIREDANVYSTYS